MQRLEIVKLDFSRKMYPWVNIACINSTVHTCYQRASMKVRDNAKPKLKSQITCRRSPEVIKIGKGRSIILKYRLMAQRPKNKTQ